MTQLLLYFPSSGQLLQVIDFKVEQTAQIVPSVCHFLGLLLYFIALWLFLCRVPPSNPLTVSYQLQCPCELISSSQWMRDPWKGMSLWLNVFVTKPKQLVTSEREIYYNSVSLGSQCCPLSDTDSAINDFNLSVCSFTLTENQWLSHLPRLISFTQSYSGPHTGGLRVPLTGRTGKTLVKKQRKWLTKQLSYRWRSKHLWTSESDHRWTKTRRDVHWGDLVLCGNVRAAVKSVACSAQRSHIRCCWRTALQNATQPDERRVQR